MNQHRSISRLGAAFVIAGAATLPALGLALHPEAAEKAQWIRASQPSAWWQALTCHWTHWNATHLAYDAGAFACLLGLALVLNPRGTLAALVLATVAIPGMVAIGEPGIETYRGLSGLCSALFVLAALELIGSGARIRDGALVAAAGAGLVLFVGKILFEYATGTAVFVADLGPGVMAVPSAHVTGALAGALPALWRCLRGGGTPPPQLGVSLPCRPPKGDERERAQPGLDHGLGVF